MIICNNIVVKTKDSTETYKFKSYNESLIEHSDGIKVIFEYKSDDIIICHPKYTKELIGDSFTPIRHVYQKKHGTYHIDLTDEENVSIRFEEDDILNTISDLRFVTIEQSICLVENEKIKIHGKHNSFYTENDAIVYMEDEKLHIHILDHENKICSQSFFKIYYDADVKFKDEYLNLTKAFSDLYKPPSPGENEHVCIMYTVKDNVLLDFTLEVYRS